MDTIPFNFVNCAYLIKEATRTRRLWYRNLEKNIQFQREEKCPYCDEDNDEVQVRI